MVYSSDDVYRVYHCKDIHLNDVKPIHVKWSDSSTSCFIHSASDGILIQKCPNYDETSENDDPFVFYGINYKVVAQCQYDDEHLLLAVVCKKSPKLLQWSFKTKKIVRIFNTNHFKKFVCVYENFTDRQLSNRQKCVGILKLDEDQPNNMEYTVEPITDMMDIHLKCVSFCHLTGDIVIKTKPNCCLIVNLYNFVLMNHSQQKFTIDSQYKPISCLQLSEDGKYLAVGTTNGSIHVFEVESKTLRNRFHWHCQSVKGLYFDNPSSNYLYSIGTEGVLVQWEISTKARRFIPRTSNHPLKYIVGGKNQLLLVDKTDEIICVNANALNVYYRSGFFRNSPTSTVGFCYCPVIDCVVSSGRWGMLDFYSPRSHKILMSLSVLRRNIVTVNHAININVTHVLFVQGGQLMITVEQPIMSVEQPIMSVEQPNQDQVRSDFIGDFIKIKWWEFNANKQSFKLIQTLSNPHFFTINSLSANNINSNKIDIDTSLVKVKSNDHNLTDAIVTTSKDKFIKIWIVDNNDNKTWYCVTSLNYKQLEPNSCCFSQSSDILAVNFDSCVTLWNVNEGYKFTMRTVIPYDQPTCLVFGHNNVNSILCIASNVSKNCSFYNVNSNAELTCIVKMNDKNVCAILADPTSCKVCLIVNSTSNSVNIEVYDLALCENIIREELEFDAVNFKNSSNNKKFILEKVKTRKSMSPIFVIKNVLKIPKRKLSSFPKVSSSLNNIDWTRMCCFGNNFQINDNIEHTKSSNIQSKEFLDQPLFILDRYNNIFCISNNEYINQLIKCKNVVNSDTLRIVSCSADINDIKDNSFKIDVSGSKNVSSLLSGNDNHTKNKSFDTDSRRLLLRKFSEDMSMLSSHTLPNSHQLLNKLIAILINSDKNLIAEDEDDDKLSRLEHLITTAKLTPHNPVTKEIKRKPLKRKNLDFLSDLI